MRYRLRTLVILTAIGPPALAGLWFYGGTEELWLAYHLTLLSFGFVLFLIAVISGARTVLAPLFRLFD